MFKTKKQPFLELFLKNIKYLAWSDPNYNYDPNYCYCNLSICANTRKHIIDLIILVGLSLA